MEKELLERGLHGTTFALEGGATFTGEKLKLLLDILTTIDQPLHTLERKGVSLAQLQKNAVDGVLPTCRVFYGGKELWFKTLAEAEAYMQAQAAAHPNLPSAELQELHEIKSLSRHLERMKEFGLGLDSLITPPSVGGVEPAPRYSLENADQKKFLMDMRPLPEEIRKFGEKGMTITRFKGLGEMNPDELWDTTLDPEKRVLLQVRLDTAIKADEMFRILMGDKVEPRREFIERHALEVRNLDV
jgi:DNA gyrase subunit B